MEIYTRPRSQLRKTLLVYGPLFLVPAVAVFVLIQIYFRGLPPRYATEMVFRVDPHLHAAEVSSSDNGASSATLMMDVRSIAIEIKSRDRLQEALKGLPLYEERGSEEKKQLLLEQALENLRVKVEREYGQNAYLVTLSITLSAKDPAQIRDLALSIHAVYKKYNIEQLINEAVQVVDRLDRRKNILARDFEDAESALTAFLEKKRNSEHLGDPPPILKEYNAVKRELFELETQEGEDVETRRKAKLKELQQIEVRRKNTPSILRQNKMLNEMLADARDRLDGVTGDLKRARDALKNLRERSVNRFAVVRPPVSLPVESERSSRLLLGLALGFMAGLAALLAGLLLGILGGD